MGWGWGGGSPLAFQECRRRNDQQLSSRRPCQLGASRGGAAAGQSTEDLRCVVPHVAGVRARCSPPPQLRNFPPTPLAHLAPASLAQFQSGPGQLPTGCESHQTRPLTYLLVRELTRLQPRREHLVSDFQLTASACPLNATAWIM